MEGELQIPQIKMQSDDSTQLSMSFKRAELYLSLTKAQERKLVNMTKTFFTKKHNILSDESKRETEEKVSQHIIAALKSEIMEQMRDLSNIPEVSDAVRELAIRAQKKWAEIKKVSQSKLVEENCSMQIFLKEKIESIEKLRLSHDHAKENTLRHADGSTDLQMTKINEEIDYVTKLCDKMELKIAELKKSNYELTAKLVQIRKSNEELVQKIQHQKQMNEANAETLSELKNYAQLMKAGIVKRTREIGEIKEKKIFAKKQLTHLISSLDDITVKNAILYNEVNELILKNDKQLAQLQQTESNAEQKQIEENEGQNQLELVKIPLLLKDKQMQMQMSALQDQLNVRQSQYEAIKQFHDQILEKRQQRTATASTLTARQVANGSKLETLHNFSIRIIDKKNRMVETLKRRGKWLEQNQPAKIPSLCNENEVSSTIGIPKFEEQDDQE